MPNGEVIDINEFVRNGATIDRAPNNVVFIHPLPEDTPTDYIA